MAADEPEQIRQDLQDIVERLERMNVRKAMPNAGEQRDLEELMVMLETARRVQARFEDCHRRDIDARRTVASLEAMNASNAALLKAINANMKTTNELLRTSEERLVEIETSVILKGQSAFSADPDVLAEGEYL